MAVAVVVNPAVSGDSIDRARLQWQREQRGDGVASVAAAGHRGRSVARRAVRGPISSVATRIRDGERPVASARTLEPAHPVSVAPQRSASRATSSRSAAILAAGPGHDHISTVRRARGEVGGQVKGGCRKPVPAAS